MQELKFRAWHKEGKYMFDVAGISFDRRFVLRKLDDETNQTIHFDEIELMQCSNVKDKKEAKNGKI